MEILSVVVDMFLSPADKEHVALVLEFSGSLFQAICACGWSSSITYFEEADLLRAIHVHEVICFKSFSNLKIK